MIPDKSNFLDWKHNIKRNIKSSVKWLVNCLDNFLLFYLFTFWQSEISWLSNFKEEVDQAKELWEIK